MASILKGRIKRFPSGMTSVVISQISPSSPLGSRAKLRQRPTGIMGVVLRCAIFMSWVGGALPAGKGRLGKKKKASWKTLRGARERMAAIEQKYGVANCGFLTLTLPSVSNGAFEALARYSSYAMDRLNRVLNRYFVGQNLARVSVWEYQKRGALHCHLLIASHCIHAIKKAELIAYMQKAWYRILSDIGEFWGANMFLSSNGESRNLEQLRAIKNKKDENVFVNFQIVRKSIVAYLSRYLADSNHEGKGENKQALREKFFPIATWVQWNKEATKCYEEYLDEFDLGECEIDKKPLLYMMIRALKKRIAKTVPLARKTEIKEPQNPYNCGLYVLPCNPNSMRFSALIVDFIERTSIFFRQNLKEKYQARFRAMTEEELDVQSTIGYIENERYRDFIEAFSPDKYCNKKIANNVVNIGLFVLDLGQAFIERFKPITYEQLRLNYE